MLSGRLYGPRCLLRSVNHSDNVHLVWLDVIDDSVGAFQDFPVSVGVRLKGTMRPDWERLRFAGNVGETVNDSQAVLW